MRAVRLTLLCAFAGGCLSNAVLFGIWRIAEGGGGSAAKQQHPPDDVVGLVTAASAGPSVRHASALFATTAAGRGNDAVSEAAPTSVASDLDNDGPIPAGSAVSDVLTQLEAAYRQRIPAEAPPQASSTQERATPAPPPDIAVAAAEAAASAPAEPVTAVTALAPVIAPAPAAPAPAELVPAAPAVAFQDAPPPTEIHYGDVNQNTYITNVREGDVYQIQMQQIAVLQYLQLLGAPAGLNAPARRAGLAGHQRGALSSGITNPDNPWGFRFAPPNLVR